MIAELELGARVVAACVPGDPNGEVVTVGGNWYGIKLDDGQLIWALAGYIHAASTPAREAK